MKAFVLDVDGVLTTGHYLYTAEGKTMKIFGPDDADALGFLKSKLQIHFVSGDKEGFQISKRRIVEDMKYPLDLVNPADRVAWIEKKWPLKDVIYMGDGIFDQFVFEKVGYGIAPQNADRAAKNKANFVTERGGGDRAVAEAAMHIVNKFFGPFNFQEAMDSRKRDSTSTV